MYHLLVQPLSYRNNYLYFLCLIYFFPLSNVKSRYPADEANIGTTVANNIYGGERYETKKIAQFHEFKDALYYAHLVANCKGLDRQC